MDLTSRMCHHGAAANSNANVVTFVRFNPLQVRTGSDSDDDADDDVPHGLQDDNDDDTLSTSSSPLVYASHAVVNVAWLQDVSLANGTTESVWQVKETLRTTVLDRRLPTSATATAATTTTNSTTTTITCLCPVLDLMKHSRSTGFSVDQDVDVVPVPPIALVTALSDGTVILWWTSIRITTTESPVAPQQQPEPARTEWHEMILLDPALSGATKATASANVNPVEQPVPLPLPPPRAIHAMDAAWMGSQTSHDQSGDSTTAAVRRTTMYKLMLVTGSSAGATCHQWDIPLDAEADADADAATPPCGHHTMTVLTETTHSGAHAIQIVSHPAATQTTTIPASTATTPSVLVFIGTAAPRQNQIHVYQQQPSLQQQSSSPQSSSPFVFESLIHVGGLTGHQDWITSLDWTMLFNHRSEDTVCSYFLASGSQDTRIRLWKFITQISTTTTTTNSTNSTSNVKDSNGNLMPNKIKNPDNAREDDVATSSSSNDEMEHHLDDEQDDEQESRLEIASKWTTATTTTTSTTHVILEALLLGHEESVTSVCWHPSPELLYGLDPNVKGQTVSPILLSSSLDRSIFLWGQASTSTATTLTSEAGYRNGAKVNLTGGHDGQGIWTPLTRVGSAGGILGGPIGSTLLGYCKVLVEPNRGQTIVGHAYGGALHVWNMDNTHRKRMMEATTTTSAALLLEERAAVIQWKARACVTGHFRGVTDLCWEPEKGAYLLTVSQDQTCRLWAPISSLKPTNGTSGGNDSVWIELARPQVHGYDLTSVSSLSSSYHPHLLVTAANEKELRVFDAPQSAINILQAAAGIPLPTVDPVVRVERAYIPSLGLSNKARAGDAAQDDTNQNSNNNMTGNDDEIADLTQQESNARSMESIRLPLERDLGAVSVWPEKQKMFGHNTELYCTTSILAARTSGAYYGTEQRTDRADAALIASSGKSRDMHDASIRLWDARNGVCRQVLANGHKATVVALAFSPSGQFLASAGKDRRLSLWHQQQQQGDDRPYHLVWAKEGAHKRIIWSVHFCPMDGTVLASGSRDGCVKIWNITNITTVYDGSSGFDVRQQFSFAPQYRRSDGKPDAVTALSFAPVYVTNEKQALLALGLESGLIELWTIPLLALSTTGTTLHPTLALKLPLHQCHAATVTKLSWRCVRDASDAFSLTSPLYLASSSMDHGCRVIAIDIVPR